MPRLLVPIVLVALVVGAALVADRPDPKADFTFINRGDVTTLDLQRMSWMQDLRAANLIFEGLTRNDVFTPGYDIRPAAAERWTVSADGLTYTFFLREDGRWSNGEPVTAHDFVYAWRRALLPEVPCDYFKLFQLIDGAEAFYLWRTDLLAGFEKNPPGTSDAVRAWEETERRFDEMVGVRALDDRTLRVKLVGPTPYFLDLCAMPPFFPVYRDLVRAYEPIDPATGRVQTLQGWTKPPHLISNGPFKLVTWRYLRDMRLEANEHYWDRTSLAIDSISIPSVEDPSAQVLAYRTGAVDWVSDVTPAYRAEMLAEKEAFYGEHRAEVDRLRGLGLDLFEVDRRLPADPRKHLHVFPAFGTYWYNFNCLPRLPDGRDNPFHDPLVRRAFSMAIDRDSIVRDIRRLGEPAATAIIPPGSIGGYRGPRGLAFDPAAARELLARAGYPDPSRFITVEILFNKDSGHDLLAQAVAKHWEQHLGVSVSLAQKEIKVFRDDLKKANYMVARAGWYADYGDPTTFLDLNRTGDGNNDRKYSNPVYDGLLDRASRELDPAARMGLLAEAERIIVEEDLPLAPIYHYVNIYLFDPDRISGISPHPRSTQYLHLIDVLGDGRGADSPLRLPAADGGPAAAGAGGPGTPLP